MKLEIPNCRLSQAPRQRGAVLIELTLILPVLILLGLGVVEATLAISEYKAVVRQVRAAARHLTSQTPGSGREQAVCIVRTGDALPTASCNRTIILRGFNDPSVKIEILDSLSKPTTQKSQNTTAYGSAVSINLVTVSVSGYPYTPITGNFLKPIFGTVIRFGDISVTMRQIL